MEYNISTQINETYQGVELIQQDAQGNPINLTGAGIVMTIRLNELTTVRTLSVGAGITVTDAINGRYRIDPFLVDFGPEDYYYDIVITQGGSSVTYLQGAFEVEPDSFVETVNKTLLEDVYDTVMLYKNRGQSQYFDAESFVNALHTAQVELFNVEFNKYDYNSTISELFQPFIKETTIAVNDAGQAIAFPDDSVFRIIEVRYNDQIVDFIKQNEWARRVNNKMYPPTDAQPVFKHAERGLLVRPVTVTQLEITYLASVEKPIFATTLSTDGRTEIFDRANSTDLQWNYIAFPALVKGTLSELGIPLKDEELMVVDQMRPPIDEFKGELK